MQLSLHADYSCRVLIYLALRPEELVLIKDVSEAYGISTNHLVKVVHKLGKLGFVETVRGRGGGVRLAMEPEEISLGKVIRQTEPGFTMVECFDQKSNTCPITPVCGLKHVLSDATEAFLAAIDDYTLADVAKQKGKLRSALGL